MSDLQRLVDAARSRTEPAAAGAPPTFEIESDAEADRAFDGLIDYFGADRSRAEVQLVVDGAEVGYLAREDLYGEAIVVDRGFGGSAGAGLPGSPTGGGGVLVLRCPEPGCPTTPVLRMSYDEDHAPHCEVHAGTALVLDAA